MKANPVIIEEIIEQYNIDLTKYIAKKLNIPIQEALQILITTGTYRALNDKKTKLYCESICYLIEMLDEDLKSIRYKLKGTTIK